MMTRLQLTALALLWTILTVTVVARPGFARNDDTKTDMIPEAAKNFPNDGPLFDEYRNVAKDLRCPTCTGLSILESEAKFSEQIKGIVKEQVAAGKHKDEILQYFTERYGPWILRAPPKTGFNALAWAFPIVLLVLGPPLVWFFVWRKRRVVSSQGVRSSDAIIHELHAQLDELRGLKGKGATT